MADPSPLMNYLKRLEESLASKVFAEATTPQLTALAISHKPGGSGLDEFGRQLNVLDTLSTKPILGVSYVSARGEGVAQSGGVTLAELRKRATAGTRASPNLLLMGDVPLQGGFMRGAVGVGAGERAAPIVPVKSIFSRLFPEIAGGARGSTRSIIQAIEESGGTGPLAGLHRKLTELGVTSTGPEAERLAFLFGEATYEAQRQGGEVFNWYKRQLHHIGMEGLSSKPDQLLSATDPHGINNIRSAIKPGTKAYFRPGGPGSTSIDAFTEVVTKQFGKEYATAITGATARLQAVVGGDQLAFAVSESGVFIGQHGVTSSFVDIPSPLALGGTTSRETGMMTSGGKLSTARDVVRGGVRVSAPEAYLENFVGMFEEVGGRRALAGTLPSVRGKAMHVPLGDAGTLGFGDLYASYTPAGRPTAAAVARSQEGGIYTNIDKLTAMTRKSTMVDRGKFSLYRGFYDRYSLNYGGAAFENFERVKKAMYEGLRTNTLSRGVVFTKIAEALEKDLLETSHIMGQIDPYVTAAARNAAREAVGSGPEWEAKAFATRFGAMKGSNLLTGIVPTAMTSHLFLPGELAGQRGIEKAFYQQRGVQEIIDPDRIEAIKSTRFRLGLGRYAGGTRIPGPQHHLVRGLETVGTTKFDVAFKQLALEFAGSPWAEGTGYKGAKRIVTEFPALTMVLGGIDRPGSYTEGMRPGQIASRKLGESFGADSAAVWQSRGVLGGQKRATPAKVLNLTKSESIEFLKQAAAEDIGPGSPGYELLQRLQGDKPIRGGKYILPPSRGMGMKVSKRTKRGRAVPRRTVTLPGFDPIVLPRDATHMTGFSVDQDVYKFYFAREGAPSAQAILLNRTRLTGRAGGDEFSKTMRMLGLEDVFKGVDLVTTAENLKDNVIARELIHRTELVGLLPRHGGYEQRLRTFAGMVEGVDVVAGQGGVSRLQFVPGADTKKLLEETAQALKDLGATPGQIEAEAKSMMDLLARRGHVGFAGMTAKARAAAIERAKAKDTSTKLYLSMLADRFGETADIGEGAMRARMTTLMTMFETLPAYLGRGMDTAAKHPAYIAMAATLMQKSRGLKPKAGSLDKMLSFRELLPDELMNMIRPFAEGMTPDTIEEASRMTGQYATGKLGGRKGVKVVSLEDAYKMLATGERGLGSTAGGVRGKQVIESQLFDPKRAGFYLDLGKEVEFSSDMISQLRRGTEGTVAEGTGRRVIRSQLQYIPSGRYMLKAAGFVEGGFGRLRPGKDYDIGKDRLAKSVLKLVESGQFKPGDAGHAEAVDKIEAAARAVTGTFRERMGKGGAFIREGMTADIATSGRARLLQRIFPEALKKGSKAMELSTEMFTVEVGEQYLRSKIGEKAFKAIDWSASKQGMYAYLESTPFHAAHQSAVVKLKLNKALTGVGTEGGLALHPYLASIFSRDMDKDTIAFFLFGEENKKLVQSYIGGAPESVNQLLKQTLQAQIDANRGIHKIWRERAMDAFKTPRQIEAELKTLKKVSTESLTNLAQRMVPLMGFGSFPSLPFVQLDANKGVLSMLARAAQEGSETVFEEFAAGGKLEGTFKKAVTKESIDKYLDFLVKGREGVSVGARATSVISEFTALNQPIYQAAIQKGGKLQAFFDEFLGIGGEVAKLVESKGGIGETSLDDIYGVVKGAVHRTLAGIGDPKSKDFIEGLAKMSGKAAEFGGSFQPVIGRYSEMIAEGRGAAALEMAEDVITRGFTVAIGVRYEYADIANMTDIQKASYLETWGMRMPTMGVMGVKDDLINLARAGVGDLEKAVKMFFPGRAGGFSSIDEVTLQHAATGGPPPGVKNPGVLDEALNFMAKRPGLIAGGIGAVLGIKALGGMFGSDELPPPSISSARSLQGLQAPLPRSMNMELSAPEAQFAPSQTRQRAFVQPVNSQYSSNSARGTSSSVNINEFTTNFARNMGAISSNNVNLNINDHRSFRSDYEMQMRVNRMNDSDFIHQYMGDVV